MKQMRFGWLWLGTTALGSALLCAACLGSPQPEPPTGSDRDASVALDSGAGAGMDAGGGFDAGGPDGDGGPSVADGAVPRMDAAVDGGLPDGDILDGDIVDGDIVDGDVADGDIVDGDVADGDVADAAPDASDDGG